MTPKPGTHLELIEPLRNFLESFTQELTEQQFVPAFRDELRQLAASLDYLKQSEETMQQIARGVERLREVFAPAGNRLLEGVKDIEQTLQTNANAIKDRATEVLKDLSQTHEQLETSLRNEAGLLKEHSVAGRDALERTVIEMEERLQSLSGQIDRVCKRAEAEIGELVSVSAPRPEAAIVAAPSGPVKIELPEELRDLLNRTEQFVSTELVHYRQEIQQSIIGSQKDQAERLQKLEKSVEASLGTIGPKVQEELDSVLVRLRDQMQTLAQVEAEVNASKQGGGQVASDTLPASVTAAISASEGRLLRELNDQRKAQKNAQTASERALATLIDGFTEAAEKQSAQMIEDSAAVKESVGLIEGFIERLQEEIHQSGSKVSSMKASVESVVTTCSALSETLAVKLAELTGRMDNEDAKREEKMQADWQAFEMLGSQVTRVERASTAAADLITSDARSLRDNIERGLKELHEQLDGGFNASREQVEEALQRLALAWSEELGMLRDGVGEIVAKAVEVITTQTGSLEARLQSNEQAEQRLQRELQAEFKRTTGLIEERLLSLQTDTETFTASVEGHVKAVSNDVASLRANDDQSLAVLKEAIRANYDDNAARLREVLDHATDSFVKQIGLVPQSLDRYSRLMESMHQGEQLALQGIESDTKNLLRIASEHFDAIDNDNAAMKKYFPLLDKKLDKQTADMDGLRKALSKETQDVNELRSAVASIAEQQQAQGGELRVELIHVRDQQREGLDEAMRAVSGLHGELSTVKDSELPNFRRELANLLSSKFEFMETTLNERHEQLRSHVYEKLDKANETNRKTARMVLLLVGLSIVIQLALHFK